MATFSFEIIESESEIEKAILIALKTQVDKYFKNVFKNIKDKLSNAVIEALTNAPEYDSLINGRLKAEFGIPDPEIKIQQLFSIWKNINFKYTPVTIQGSKLSGSFILEMIRSDLSDVLSSDATKVITEKGQTLNWLEWLCLEDNKTIIKDYRVEFGQNPYSRTGLAVMRKDISSKWKVPSEFSGNIDNNWITRSIDGINDKINSIIIDGFKL